MIISAITSLFSASGAKRWGLIGLCVACLVLALLWQHARAGHALAEAEASAYRTASEINEQTIALLAQAHQQVSLCLAEHRMAMNNIRAQREAERRAWKEAKRDDETTAEWAAASLPDAVRDRLR